MYLVDFVAVSLVSSMVMAVGGYWEWVSSSWRHGIDVLSDAAFHVSWLVGVVGLGRGIWLCTIGGVGCMYSMIGSVHLSASMSNFWGKNGNVACKSWRLGGMTCRCI